MSGAQPPRFHFEKCNDDKEQTQKELRIGYFRLQAKAGGTLLTIRVGGQKDSGTTQNMGGLYPVLKTDSS